MNVTAITIQSKFAVRSFFIKCHLCNKVLVLTHKNYINDLYII